MRLFVDNNTDVAHNLRQEFVRIRSNREEDRLAIITGTECTYMYISLKANRIFFNNDDRILFHLVHVIVRVIKVKNDHRSKFSNLSNWKEEA